MPMISLDKPFLSTAQAGRARWMAICIGLALLASNISVLGATPDWGPTVWGLTVVLAPVAALAALAPQSAFHPPVVIEANVVYRPLPDRKVRYALLLIPGTWLAASPLALLTGPGGAYVTLGVALMSLFVCLDVMSRARLEGVSFSVDEGGVYGASTMRRPLPWMAIYGVRSVGRGDDMALLLECRRPSDYARARWQFGATKVVRLSLADMTEDERRVIADRVARRLARP
ncbi:MAG: hypothetical protein ABW042_05315 [Phenylobacterium sp.]